MPRGELAALCARHGVRRLAFFGSVLRDDFGPDSDIDMLVEFEPSARVTYFTLARLESDLRRVVSETAGLCLHLPRLFHPDLRDKAPSVKPRDNYVEHDDRLPMLQMLEHAREAVSHVSMRRREDLDADRLLRLALERLVERRVGAG